MEEIGRKFNSVATALLNKLIARTTSATELAALERLLGRLRIAVTSLGPTSLISVAAPVMVEFADVLLARERSIVDKFLLEHNVHAEAQKRELKIESNDMYIFDLIHSVRTKYKLAPQQERDLYYADIKELIACSIEYQLLL